MEITIKPTEPRLYEQRPATDRKTPTRYEVFADGEKIGEVGTHSAESWDLSPNGRIRTRMRGYTRTWKAWGLDHRPVGFKHWTRQKAIDALAERAEAASGR